MTVVVDGTSGITTNSGTVVSTTDATLNGLTVGKGGGAVSTNTAVGNGAIAATATGNRLTALGYQALASDTSGYQNTAIGYQSLNANTTGTNNTAVGFASLVTNISGQENTAVGDQCLYNNTGSYNTSVGRGSLQNNTTASNNTAVGYQAGYTNVTGSDNTFIGKNAGYLSTASFNTFIGSFVGYNTTGTFNTFIGQGSTNPAGYSVTTGTKNTIIGGYTGNQSGLDIRTSSNYIVLSDGDGNPRCYWSNSGVMYQTSNSASDIIADLVNTSVSNCYGLRVRYSAVAPNTNGYYFFRAQDSSATRLDVYSNGGIANYQANNVNLSDQREKKNIELAPNYLDKICQIPVKTFLLNDQTDEDLNLGVIAQDVQAVCPELVTESDWGTEENPKMRLSIYQTDLQYALMKSIQELKTIVDAQAAEIAELKAKVNA